MSYECKVLEVFLAHPGDTKAEALIAAETILRWNTLHGKSHGLQLQPRLWEIDVPSSVSEDVQQEIITHHLTQCDLLIALFKTRLGTPNARAVSNTVEELMAAVKAGKPAMLFSLPLGDIRPDPAEYQRLCAWFSTIEDTSIICNPGQGAFENELYRHITLIVNRAFPSRVQKTSATRPELIAPSAAAPWLAKLSSKSERLAVQKAMPVLIKEMPNESPTMREAIFLIAEKEGVSRNDMERALLVLTNHGYVKHDSIDLVGWTQSGYEHLYPG